MPGYDVKRWPGVGIEALWWFGAQVLDRIADDFRPGERLDRIQQLWVVQEIEHSPAARVHDVHFLIHAFALTEEEPETGLKRLVFVQFGNLPLVKQFPGARVNPVAEFIYQRLQVFVIEESARDDKAVSVEGVYLLLTQCHELSPSGSICR